MDNSMSRDTCRNAFQSSREPIGGASMKIRKRLIALLVLLAFVVAGCSATPKFTKIAGTVVNENGRPMPKVGVIIGSSLAQTNSAGQFTLQAPSQEKQATLLINGYRPQTLPLNLGGESQAIILTAKPAKPTRRSGSEVDYILLLDSTERKGITSASPFTYLAGNDAKEAARQHAGILNLNEAVEYLSPETLQELCRILKARHIVWINKDLSDHLQIFSARTNEIHSLPLKNGKTRSISSTLASALRTDFLQAKQKPYGTEARLAREVTTYMEQIYEITYGGSDIRRIEEVAAPVIAVSERPNLPFTFGILETSEYNAYALPGGYIYITRPLLEMLDSDDEVAAVIAHETSHITHVHAVKSYDRQVALTVAGVFLAVATGDAESSFDFVNAIGDIIKVGYSKDQEYDADRTGLRYISRAGYDPQAMVSLLTKLEDLEYRLTGGRQGYSRTHPATKKRIQQVREKLDSIHYYRFFDMYIQSL